MYCWKHVKKTVNYVVLNYGGGLFSQFSCSSRYDFRPTQKTWTQKDFLGRPEIISWWCNAPLSMDHAAWNKCILPGCDTLQNSSVFLFKCICIWRLREVSAVLRVGVVSELTADTPPVFENREYCLFLEDFDNLFYLLFFFFLYNSNLAGWLITHFSLVWQTHIFNIALHGL